MHNCVFLKLPNSSRTILTLPYQENLPIKELLNEHKIPSEKVFVTSGGNLLDLNSALQHGETYNVFIRAKGGKGGFGSMLRAIGAQIEKTTNREACRDLSGRRMRDVNNEKKMVEYLEKKTQMDEEKAKKKMEKLEKLTKKPHHVFNDPDYERNLHDAIDKVDNAVQQGVAKLKTKPDKRKTNENSDEPHAKKKQLWLGDEFDDLSESDSDSVDESIPNIHLKTSKSQTNGESSSKNENTATSYQQSSNKEQIEKNEDKKTIKGESQNKNNEKDSKVNAK